MSSPNPPDNSTDQSSQNQPNRPLSSAWTSAPSSSRRGLTPISTTFASVTRPGTSHSPRNPWSPTSAPAGHASRQGFRSSSISSSRGPVSPPPPGQGQGPQPLRSISSSTDPPLASHTPSSSQGAATGGSSSGGGIGSRLSRASPSLSIASFGSPPLQNPSTPAIGQSGSLHKIVITQLSLLLSTFPKADKDKAKFESHTEQVRKLLEQNGMEVFVKYFNKLLTSNASQIWGSSRGGESSGNYPILVAEVHKLTLEPEQSLKIAESINSGDGEIFKDFDLSTFMEHFKMTPLAKLTLATAFKTSPKPDLRTKADAIISSNLQNFLASLANPSVPGFPDQAEELQPSVIARVIARLAQHPPRSWTQDMLQQLIGCLHQRYHTLGTAIPFEISSAAFLFELLSSHNPLLSQIQKAGARLFESVDTAKATLSTVDISHINYAAVANVLLYMTIVEDEPQYNPTVFISALRDHRGGQRLDWQDVVQAFDHENFTITKNQFLKLFHALLPLAKEYENFDIQRLWGGQWRHGETHLTFATAFLSLGPDEWDPAEIPRFRKAFALEDFADAPAETKTQAENAVKQPSISADATAAIFDMVFRSQETYDRALNLGVIESVINSTITLFVASVSAVPLPWHGGLKDQAMRQLVSSLFKNGPAESGLALHLLWKRAKTWLTSKFSHYYQQNELQLRDIYEHALYHGWLHDLIESRNDFSIDLAAYAHGQGTFEIEPWLEQTAQALPGPRLLQVLTHFLRSKAEDDVTTHRESLTPQTLPLSIKTVYTILKFMGETHSQMSEDDLVQLQRTCISAYPRLINYGEGFDPIIDANSQDGNAISPAADAQMQEHYKLMYGNQKEVRHIIEDLQRYKTSQDPGEQDLFACMIFGLFDEYNCFPEYPNDALATTAVLFGSIINFNLLSRIALQAAVAMVFEAVRDYKPEESMFKFGLQALLHFQGRLEEWKRFAQRLLEIPHLRGSQIYPTIERVSTEPDSNTNGSTAPSDTRASVDDMFPPAEARYPDFMCLTVDPPIRHDFYEEPAADVQEEVLFILNNVSERNLDEKFGSLQSKLKEQHQQWFANYLVDNRIKSQPNYQQLYTEVIDRFNDKLLWSEVIRETYASIVNLLNAEATATSQVERRNLKNLGAWLGSITLARNRPIRFRNISFKDLLLEAYDTQRLPLVIPFACKVLSTASESLVFKPPNAWTMEIISLLVELYHSGDIRLNLKFEVEVLCQDLGLDHKSVQPSDVLQTRRREPEPAVPQEPVQDGIDKFGGMSVLNLGRHFRGSLSPSVIVPELNNLPSHLKHNYQANPAHLQRIHDLFADATERAVGEIIAPVVERSVAIATISAIQLVSKDLYLEPSPERFQEATRNAVRNLAGSLALVTCKEPLKQSMEHSIRALSRDDPELQIPEATIVMFTTDNIDLVCSFVEKTAEQASIKEADAQIQEELNARRDNRFNERQVSQWANYVPDPFRQHSGGLNGEQMSIYENFTRSTRGPSSGSLAHVSQETTRPIPEQLQEQLNSAANLPASADAMGRQLPQGFGNQRLAGAAKLHNGHTPVNGFEGNSYPEQVDELAVAIYNSAVEATHEDRNRNLLQSQAVLESWASLQSAINAAAPRFRDEINVRAAVTFLKLLENWQNQSPAVAEFLAVALLEVCRNSKPTERVIRETIGTDGTIFHPDVSVALLKTELLTIDRVDLQLSRALTKRQPGALEFLDQMVSSFLVTDPPYRLRAEFSHSLLALAEWRVEHPDSAAAQAISQKLYGTQSNGTPAEQDDLTKDGHFEYVFEEWARLLYNGSSTAAALSFIRQLDEQHVLNNSDNTANFIRTCVDASVRYFEQNETPGNFSNDKSYFKIDALAKLIAMLVVHQGKVDSIEESTKASFFSSILSVIVLVVSHHYRIRPERFNQKVYFRLLASIINELDSEAEALQDSYIELIKRFAESLVMLSPQVFPGFSFAWMSLVSHRFEMSELLQAPNEQGWETFTELLGKLLAYAGEPLKLFDIPVAAKDQYRGALRILLVLHHDAPEFLAENHFLLLKNVPLHCTQMRNLILHAAPPPQHDSQDGYGGGQAVQEDAKRSPRISADIGGVVQEAGIKETVDGILRSSEVNEHEINTIIRAVHSPKTVETGIGNVPIHVDQVLLNALVIYIVQQWEAQPGNLDRGFMPNTIYASLLESLMDKFDPEARYYFISAIANNLRYENCHSHFFIRATLHLFRPGQADAKALDIQKQITRCLLERVVTHRPHPWGLQVTVLELLRGQSYHFWELPFIKAYPEVERMFGNLLAQMSGPRPTP